MSFSGKRARGRSSTLGIGSVMPQAPDFALVRLSILYEMITLKAGASAFFTLRHAEDVLRKVVRAG